VILSAQRQISIAAASLLLAGAFMEMATGREPITFIGACDASAAAAIDHERFVIADDEDNVLRVYSRAGGRPLYTFDLSEFLGVQGKKKSKETDLEAATQLGDHTFWITSHGRNSKGKDKPERQRLFATSAKIGKDGAVEITPVGQPYSDLLDDLLTEERLAPFGLEAASKLAPKAPGGLNIEGLAATPEGHLLIGFRSPLREGSSLVVPLLNPREVCRGEKARFGAPKELNLGNLGIRSLEYCGGRYLIIAGDTGAGDAAPKLFEWNGESQVKPIAGVALTGLNPEGVAFRDAKGVDEYMVLSDDGTRLVDGKACKDLKDPEMKRFRGQVFTF
jgi:hypothetical protein